MLHQAILALAAAGFAVMGLLSITSPARVTSLFGIGTLDRDARNEIRGVQSSSLDCVRSLNRTEAWHSGLR